VICRESHSSTKLSHWRWCTLDCINLKYEAWGLEDQTLLVWLQSTLSKLVLCQVLGLSHSYGVWEKIHEYFGPRIKPQMLQMHTAIHTVCLILNQWKSILRKWTLRIDKFLEKELYFSLEFWQDTCWDGILGKLNYSWQID